MVSVLWLSTSGSASSTAFKASSSPLKSGIKTSTRQPGFKARTCRMVSAQCAAPPSRRSSRVTEVMTAGAGAGGRGGAERLHRFGDVARLFGVERDGLPLRDGAEAAVARADVAADHEGRRPVRPALEDVRAARLLADGVEVQVLDQLQNVGLVRRVAETYLQPLGLGALRRTGRGGVVKDTQLAAQTLSPCPTVRNAV